ncbi:neutral zinc metallopeptidase [Kribbella swartbergensis]
MGGAAKGAAFVLVAVLTAVAAGAATQPEVPAVAEAVVVPNPTPSPSATPKRAPAVSMDPTLVPVKNGLYTAGRVPTVSCKVPSELARTRAGLLAYARVMVECMQRAWSPLVLRAGRYLPAPRIDAYVEGKSSGTQLCGNPPRHTDAFYRSMGHVICFEWREFADPDDDKVWNHIDFQEMLAHEYGHHLQETVDILRTYVFRHPGGSEAAQLEGERRLELQASCLGAAFLGAHKRSLRLTGRRLDVWQDMVKHTGDEYNPEKIRDHGSRKNHGYWSLRAFTSMNPASCNTFAAPAMRVS